MNHFNLKMTAVWVSVCLLTACGGGGGDSPVAGAAPAAGVVNLAASLTALPLESLSAAETASLAFMREEEKLAQDVYAQLDALWGTQTRVFGNITQSEATHTEAVRQLLVRYALPDPTAALAAGVYQNATLQTLYTTLVATGSVSLVDGLQVGAAIEEIDIIDLQTALAEVDNQDINLVYQLLLKGSRNHLRAFVSALSGQGVTYAPQYMALADYQAIVTTPMER